MAFSAVSASPASSHADDPVAYGGGDGGIVVCCGTWESGTVAVDGSTVLMSTVIAITKSSRSLLAIVSRRAMRMWSAPAVAIMMAWES